MSQKRRTFLKSLGLAGLAGLTLDVNTLQAAPKVPAKGKDLSIVSLSGKVQAQGKGIPGVAVTDGINVTLTDAKGNYELESNATADFVYISVPRGHEFANEKGIARFYKRIEPARGRFKADFELQKLNQDDSKHNFIVWADPQMISKADAEEFKTKSAPDTKQLLDSYGKDTLFHGIGCGDLVWDHFELFDDYKEGVATTGIPYFQVIGNHDMDLNARTDDFSSETFKKLFGPSYYSFNRGEIHYVVLDDVFFVGTAKKYIGYITERQLAWLEQDLAQVKAGTTVVVNLHIPTNSGDKRRNNLKDEPMGGVVANRRELYRILEPYKAHIMSGHTHVNEKVFEGDNIIEHTHGAVCGAWWTGPICQDGSPSGYGVYEVNGSDIQWYYKSVGKDKAHQLRIYPVGAVKEKPEHLSVNVWNWDPEWKVEWFEDGKSMGAMQRETAFDPLSVELHLGAAKPAKHKWVEPSLTDHMFFARPSASAQRVMVQATDRFKNVYKEEVSLEDLKLSHS
ncbi:calcineurin-like phosphoesterase C-terminal domain-containing protein [Pontibacter silvestris]|uniref:Calcineurin-like phosphoesterase C-terminal domain-containing protein n=1 Tax=Pontibacter silvestris TaxID=2305183 RepID=A0ABW4WUD4_9BACT|nr:calcineurin-like phosphoesterase family protein [Pontibacter silvestris]MCC9138768.1 calcineurin-like phosphoesterase family protein [Pontibacter silvestris]